MKKKKKFNNNTKNIRNIKRPTKAFLELKTFRT